MTKRSEDNFRIARGMELIAVGFKLCTKFNVVVDFAIVGDGQAM